MMNSRLKQVRRVFLDMDGTIYEGDTLYPTTVPFLRAMTERGIGYTFLSNNSSFSTEEYVKKLARMGIPASEENFYISTDYTIDYLKTFFPSFKRIFLLGMPCIVPEFEKAGFTVCDSDPDAVIVAFDRSLVYERLCRACYLLHEGVPGFATHPDVFCPTDKATFLPDCGALTACIETATGVKLKVLGKPDPGMLRCAAARYGVKPEECLMVGDRLHTDIAVGVNAGSLTCHIYHPEMELKSEPVPTFRVTNLGELQSLFEEGAE